MDFTQLVLVGQALASVAMAGIIWFVQVVHYPLFARVPAEEFPAFAREHAVRTGRVVVAPMVVELFSALALVFLAWRDPAATGAFDLPARALATGGLLLVVLIWLATFLLQVPCHRRLAGGRDLSVIRRLVRTNALRTAGWSLRALLAVVWLAGAPSG